MKIAFGMIVFEGDYVLQECLESVYPYANQILVAEGPVKYWQDKNRTTSLDRTNEILDNFSDPDNKINITHGQFSEKDEQCKSYMRHIDSDTDYIWNLDSDEVYKAEDIEKIIKILELNLYTSIGVRSCSFYGGFDRYIGGFEEKKDNFLRIFKTYPGATWKTHRPPTIITPIGVDVIPNNHLDSDSLFNKYGVKMYHYSYVFPIQVKNKIEYYRNCVSKEYCHPNYYNEIYNPWMRANDEDRLKIEKTWNGVHEFTPIIREESFTRVFDGEHPEPIKRNLNKHKSRIAKELELYA